MAREKYGVDDEEILSAIACHTTGKTDMGMLDKILYVADYIEPRRYKAADLPRMKSWPLKIWIGPVWPLWRAFSVTWVPWTAPLIL